MPLLSDAKTCYVGTQPITKIYAGTQFVWPKSVVEIIDFNNPEWNILSPAQPIMYTTQCAFSWSLSGDLCEMWKNGTLVFHLYGRPEPNGYFSYNGNIPGTQSPINSTCHVVGSRIYFTDNETSRTESLGSYSVKCAICQYYNGSLLQESSSIVPNSLKNPYPPVPGNFRIDENLCN